MGEKPVAVLKNVTKFYGEKLVFRDLSLQILAASLTLLLGSNGAGKSTLLRIIGGLASPTSGCIELLCGQGVAYLGHASFLYGQLTALQNLDFWAQAHNLRLKKQDLMDFLKRVRLEGEAHYRGSVLSRGMCQRLNFARVLMLSPALLLLDEPFSGMDAESRDLLHAEMEKLKACGTAILLVSHDLAADAPLAERVCVIKNHVLDFCGTAKEYLGQSVKC